MGKRDGNLPVLSDRALNRATLARQGLLQRQAKSVPEMLEHLLGLQGQVHKAPYIGLWSRLASFGIADLETLLQERKAVRATMMRCTLHVATADDFLAIRPLIQPLAMRGFRANHLKPLGGADLEAIREASRNLLDGATLLPAQLGSQLKQRWPECDPIALSMPARFLEPVVHVPPAGLWGATKPPELTSAKRWLGRDAVDPMAFDALVLRYLRAFGPATGNDFGAWSGLPGGPAAMERLREQLVSFAGEDGRELFDLPDAPRPDEGTEAPVRLLPDYDNVVVGYENRARMLRPEHFKGLTLANGMRPGFTIDGFVRGTWKLAISKDSATIAFLWFDGLGRQDKAVLVQEGEALLARFAPGQKPEISFAALSGN